MLTSNKLCSVLKMYDYTLNTHSHHQWHAYIFFYLIYFSIFSFNYESLPMAQKCSERASCTAYFFCCFFPSHQLKITYNKKDQNRLNLHPRTKRKHIHLKVPSIICIKFVNGNDGKNFAFSLKKNSLLKRWHHCILFWVCVCYRN